MLSGDVIESLTLEERINMQNKKKKTAKSSRPENRPLKRANKNRPREMSSKIPVASQPQKKGNRSGVDPRFSSVYGSYDEKEFKTNYGFIDVIQAKELTKLKRKAKTEKDPEKKQQIQTVLRRMTDRERELQKVKVLRQKVALEKTKVVEALAQGRPARFKTKTESKLGELVDKFGTLKEKGKLLKYIKKKSKSKFTRFTE